MWAVALDDAKTFDLLINELKKVESFDIIVTGTGTKVAKAPLARQISEQRPHFFLADRDLEQTKNAISWVYKNLHPQALISSGICDDWRGEIGEAQEELPFVPTLCLRSAGRIDMGGGPILFEEIPFDPWIQSALVKQCFPSDRKLKAQHRIFGSDRPIVKDAERRWLSGQVQCQSFDTISGEMLLAGKRLGLKIGCLKIFARKSMSNDSAISVLLGLRVPA